MLVRIRTRSPRAPGAPVFAHHNAALAMASLLTPFALLSFTIALWSIAADVRLTASFFVATGLLSHWQVWLVCSAALLLLARLLKAYALRKKSGI
jgi:hypothetical protein